MKTEIIAILDRSGSMQGTARDAIGGFNAFIDDQKTIDGEARMSVVLFDDKFETLYQSIPIGEAPHLTNKTFVPRGMTALLDAIGLTLTTQGQRIAKEAWADQVIVCILTDGGENSSREYNSAKVREMIQHAEKHGWTFVFLAANQDAFAVGAGIGISAAHTSNYAATSAGTQSAYQNISSTVRGLRTTHI